MCILYLAMDPHQIIRHLNSHKLCHALVWDSSSERFLQCCKIVNEGINMSATGRVCFLLAFDDTAHYFGKWLHSVEICNDPNPNIWLLAWCSLCTFNLFIFYSVSFWTHPPALNEFLSGTSCKRIHFEQHENKTKHPSKIFSKMSHLVRYCWRKFWRKQWHIDTPMNM